MPAIKDDELAAIEGALRDHPDGVSMRDLVGPAASEAQRRAMQRRLGKLIDAGRARSTGERRWMRYFGIEPIGITDLSPTTAPQERAQHPADNISPVPLSPASIELTALIRQPETARTPAGYHHKFLSSYQPNVTFYLTPSERKHLAKIGAVDTATKPAGTFARQILDRLLIDLSFNSSRLEGNTYSLLDTHRLIEQGQVAEGKSAEETAMIVNHKAAIEFLVESASDIGFNRYTILNLHALLAENLLDADSLGRLRQHGVGISRSVYTPPQNPQIIEEYFAELLAKADAIADPHEQSFFVAIQLPYPQPFADVNKRVSRLSANIPFIKRNLTPVSFIDVSDDLYVEAMLSVYELNRIELARDMFVWAYERSARRYAAIQQSMGSPDQFRLRYRDALRAIVSEVVTQQFGKVAASKWIADFAAENTPASDRKQFVELAQRELLNLHEGNFARYRLRPSEFFEWKVIWERAT